MKILAIETSCDETAAAVLENEVVISSEIYTQIEIHKKFGGVVPEVASRNHLDKISKVIDKAIKNADIKLSDLDLIAVTYTPGLVGALLVGVSYAKALAYSLGIDLVAVNHLNGHILSALIENKELRPPFITLLASGGHTMLIEVRDYTDFNVLGKSRDDALGEAFDKVARLLGESYPGGPQIEKLAKNGKNTIEFPKSYLDKDSLDFSFSGIKSAVLNYINTMKMKNLNISKEDVASSFQEAVFDVVVDKTNLAVKKTKIKRLAVVGGVASNKRLRELINQKIDSKVDIYYPSLKYCTDNAAMIGIAGYYSYINGNRADLTLNAIATNAKI